MKKITIDKLSIREQHDDSNKNASDETGAIQCDLSNVVFHNCQVETTKFDEGVEIKSGDSTA